MPWGTIFRYSLHALAFGAAVCGVWVAVRALAFHRPVDRRGLVAVFYMAMVLEIIGLRLGLQSVRLLGGVPNFVPLKVTLAQWRMGPGAFIYHVAGNILWFVPLGVMLRRWVPGRRWYHALLMGLGLSLVVETLQFLLGTGMPDIDDVLLNILGAVLGYVFECFWLTRQVK